MTTDDPLAYAVGQAVEVYDRHTGKLVTAGTLSQLRNGVLWVPGRREASAIIATTTVIRDWHIVRRATR